MLKKHLMSRMLNREDLNLNRDYSSDGYESKFCQKMYGFIEGCCLKNPLLIHLDEDATMDNMGTYRCSIVFMFLFFFSL